jgi:hypothetical protein|tara:strand:- start:1237 stop:1422 length:186 start_codon:yes stop_codon:yes gene_type:complete
MHTNISNNKRKARASALVNKLNIRVPVSTVTHTTEEVAKHFLAWRKAQKKNSLIGHNNPPN